MSFTSSKLHKIIERLSRQAALEHERRFYLLLFERNREAILLDLGCGDGEFTLKVAEKIEAKEIFGVDLNGESLNEAKAKGIRVHQGDLNKRLPFEDESFDVVHAHEVVEHLCDTDNFIKEANRVLKKGGYFTLSTPNLASAHHIFYLLLGKQPPTIEVSDEIGVRSWTSKIELMNPEQKLPRHRRIFTVGALQDLLTYHGFKVEKNIGLGYYPLPNPLARIMCAIDKRHAAHIACKARKL